MHQPSGITISANRAQKILTKYNISATDQVPLVTSSREFKAGGHYGVEIPVINNLHILSKTIKLLKEEGIYCSRFNETHGSHLLSDGEITEMLHACRENMYGILFSIGPRPEYDIKASFYRSDFGLEMGRRLNNNDAIRAAIEESLRLADLGCRGIIVYDIGVLRVLVRMQKDNLLPQDMVFKSSTHCMVTNSLIAQIYEENGISSITTAHDLGLAMLQTIRQAVRVPLDVPTDVYKSKGGFIRFYELSEIIQIASPVMLKMGASVQDHPYGSTNEDLIKARVQRVKIGQEILTKHLPSWYKKMDRADLNFAMPFRGENDVRISLKL